MHDGDSLARQLGARVELLERGVIPALDLAEKDLGEGGAIDHELARLDAVQVQDRHDAAHHHRELNEAVLVELCAFQRRVRGAERHGLVLNLLDAAAGADRLVVEADVGLFLVGVRPLGVDRVGEGGAGAGDVGSKCRNSRQHCRRRTGNRQRHHASS
jgi:hypothetical protein